MIQDMSITTLVENTASGMGLLAEHGLSFWIEYADKRILFDTGQSDILIQNAKVLGINLAEADAIILSHDHYDHTMLCQGKTAIVTGASLYNYNGVVWQCSRARLSGKSQEKSRIIYGERINADERATQGNVGVRSDGMG